MTKTKKPSSSCPSPSGRPRTRSARASQTKGDDSSKSKFQQKEKKVAVPKDSKDPPMIVRQEDTKLSECTPSCAKMLFDSACGLLRPKNGIALRKSAIFAELRNFVVETIVSKQENRVTALQWHYRLPYLLAIGVKDGSISLISTNQGDTVMHKRGIGPGGSIPVLKFNPMDPDYLYMVTLEGKFKKMNYGTGKESVLFRSENFMKLWYVSFDLNTEKNLMVVGDTSGQVHFFAKDGIPIESYKLHKTNKVAHVEFSKRDPNIMCTAANDKVVKLWDIRIIRGADEDTKPLYTLPHKRPINSACFSRTDGCRLMTTDQGRLINIYRGPLFDLERSIVHPHRFYQYITPIRAGWHPQADIVIIGRYPDLGSDDVRSLDLIDADTGKIVHELLEHMKPSIKSISEFNVAGDTLATSGGQTVLLWRYPR